VPELLNPAKEIGHGLKSYPALAKGASAYYFRLDFVLIPKNQPLAYSDFPPRVDQALPLVGLLGYLTGEQYLNPAFQEFPCRWIPLAHWLGLDSTSMAVKPGREHTGVIEHNQVIWAEKVRKVAKPAVLEESGAALHVQQS
jgi:hypothetical protein